MIWFTADTHFFHKNIIDYSNRPFTSVEQMNETMVNNWNDRVHPGDIVYHLGDFALSNRIEPVRDLRSRLNGVICLIRGNHENTAEDMKDQFIWIKDYCEVKHPDPDAPNGLRKIVLCHYAMRVWNRSHYGAYHLYGHSHGSLPDDPNSLSFDVGVDCHNYRPINFEEVKEIMSKKSFKPIDHHGENNR